MKRSIIKIDEDKCNGCGICVTACAEGALKMVNGKAKLVSESYCDGLGACLPECPTGAIALEERECSPFVDPLGENHSPKSSSNEKPFDIAKPFTPPFSGCPSQRVRIMKKTEEAGKDESAKDASIGTTSPSSELRQWPCQIKLVSPEAPFFDGAHLLIAADCTAYAYANIHKEFMRNRITIIGCPKLDNVDYTEKLTQILALNDIKSVTVLKMEVPCCLGIAASVKKALMNAQSFIPWSVKTVTTDGKLLDDTF